MSDYFGDFTPGKTIYVPFNTSDKTTPGAPITLAGTPVVSVYKRGSAIETTTGVTLAVDYDGRTGYHVVAIDTSLDGVFYAAANDFDVVITAGTVDGVSVVGRRVCTFSLSNRSALRPMIADRTLDVSATNRASANVEQVDGAALGTHAAGYFPGDVRQYGGSAGTFFSGRPEVNATHAAGTAWGSGAITAASIADGAIDRATFAADTGWQSLRSGVAQLGDSGSITLDATASAIADFYKGALVLLTGGTGAGQARFITAYNGTTKAAAVAPAWATSPDGSSTFAILPAGAVNLAQISGSDIPSPAAPGLLKVDMQYLKGSDFGVMNDGAVNYMSANVAYISNDAVAADNAEKFFDGTGYGGLLVSTTIATLTSQTSFTLTAGSADDNAYGGCEIIIESAVTAARKAVGVVSAYAGSSRAVTLLTNPGVFTMAVGDIVTIQASRSLKPAVDNRAVLVNALGHVERVTLVDTTTANTDMLAAAGIRAAVGLAAANMDAQLTAIDDYLDTEIAAIKAKTDMLGVTGITNVTVTSPVAQDGSIEIIRGDDYSNADGRALVLANANGTWPDLTGASITFSATQTGNPILVVSGTVVVPSGAGQSVRVELTAAQTTIAAGEWMYDVQATLASGRIATLVIGRMSVIDDVASM